MRKRLTLVVPLSVRVEAVNIVRNIKGTLLVESPQNFKNTTTGACRSSDCCQKEVEIYT